MITWEKRPSQLDVMGYVEHLVDQTGRLGDGLAFTMEAYAKANRPWVDDTGLARAGLEGLVERTPNRVRIILRHRVAYGIFLELRRGGRYAILWPTIEAHLRLTKQLMDAMVRR